MLYATINILLLADLLAHWIEILHRERGFLPPAHSSGGIRDIFKCFSLESKIWCWLYRLVDGKMKKEQVRRWWGYIRKILQTCKCRLQVIERWRLHEKLGWCFVNKTLWLRRFWLDCHFCLRGQPWKTARV